MNMSDNFELAVVRRGKAADLAASRGAMTLRDLCDHFGVSDATMRRDLQSLDDEGRVERTHAGVMRKTSVLGDLSNDQRKSVGAEEKRRIGLASINLLSGDEVVFLDAGTTAHVVAVEAIKKPNCTYVTTSLGIARKLQSHGITDFYLIGGAYEPINDSFAGTLAMEALRSLSFDVALPPWVTARVKTEHADLLVGVRPETMRINGDDTDFSATCKISSVEYEGSVFLVHLKIEQHLQRKHLRGLQDGAVESVETSNIHQETLRALKQVNAFFALVGDPILAQSGALLDTRLSNETQDSRS